MGHTTLTLSSRLPFAVLMAVAASGVINASGRWEPLELQTANAAERIDAELEEGAVDLQNGKIKEAKELFQLVLKVSPNNVPAHTYLGVIADRENRPNDAERHFATAAKLEPSSPSAHNNFGAILVKLGRTKEAAEQFNMSLRLNSNQPSALVNLAQIRFSESTVAGLRDARELFERAAASKPDVEIARALVVTSLRLDDREAAARYYRIYSELVPVAGDGLGARRRAELGAALLEKGLGEEAIKEISGSLASDPQNVDAIILLARAYLAARQILLAGRTLESAVARGIDSAPVYAALSEVYEKSGHVENAIPAMRLAIERDPRSEAYRFRYGMLLTDSKAPAAAVIRLQESLVDFPRSSRLWFALGVAHFAEHQTGDAAKDFRRALDLDPKFAPVLAYLGMVAAEEGRYSDAVSFYERSLAIDENQAASHFLLADTLLKQVSSDSARIESELTRAVVIDPTFARARLALGKLYFQLGRFPEAAEQLQRTVDLNGNIAEAHYRLGQIYRRLNRMEDSQKELAKFKNLSDSGKEQAETDRRELVQRLAKVNF